MKNNPSSSEQRSFLTRRNAGAAAVAAMALAGSARAQVKSTAAGRFAPGRHEKDDWLDQAPGQHRLVFDTTSPDSLAQAIFFANNFMRVNRSDYGLQNSDLAVVIVVRHRSAPFGYSDAMWAKYGTAAAAHAAFEDPRSKAIPKANVFNSADYGNLMPNRGVTIDAVAKQGVQLAVCSSSTRAVAGVIARATGGDTEAIFSEITGNLVSNARMVPAGIVTVTRAQERGYSLVSNY